MQSALTAFATLCARRGAAAAGAARWRRLQVSQAGPSVTGFADQQPRKDGRELSAADRKWLRVLGLGTDVDRRALRQRYLDLVRRYHPDKNGGDRSHEKALQAVIEAYTQLKSRPVFA